VALHRAHLMLCKLVQPVEGDTARGVARRAELLDGHKRCVRARVCVCMCVPKASGFAEGIMKAVAKAEQCLRAVCVCAFAGVRVRACVSILVTEPAAGHTLKAHCARLTQWPCTTPRANHAPDPHPPSCLDLCHSSHHDPTPNPLP